MSTTTYIFIATKEKCNCFLVEKKSALSEAMRIQNNNTIQNLLHVRPAMTQNSQRSLIRVFAEHSLGNQASKVS